MIQCGTNTNGTHGQALGGSYVQLNDEAMDQTGTPHSACVYIHKQDMLFYSSSQDEISHALATMRTADADAAPMKLTPATNPIAARRKKSPV